MTLHASLQFALLTLLALVGCRGSVPSSAKRDVAVPQPLCKLRDLRVSTSTQGGAGELGGILRLRNTGRRACALARRPSHVDLVSAAGRRLGATAVPPTPARGPQKNIVLGRRSSARFVVGWSDWCGPTMAVPRLDVGIPGTGDVRANVFGTRVASCYDPASTSASVLRYGLFQLVP